MRTPDPCPRLLGQVFTPPAVAGLVARLCIRSADDLVFDPCAGEGALLLAAGRRLRALGAEGWHRRLFGIEIDPRVHARCRERLAAQAGVPSEEIRVSLGDFLALTESAGHLIPPAGEGEGEAPPGAWALRAGPAFDAAVMNPPYTRQEELPAGVKRGPNGLGARAGLHAHFWARLERFVRPGGRLGAITPGTWLAAEYGRALRAFLLERFRIHAVVDFARDVFPDASVEACVAILEKRPEAHLRRENPVRFVHLKAGADPAEACLRALACPHSGEHPDFHVQVVPQASLSAEERWSRFLIAPVPPGSHGGGAGLRAQPPRGPHPQTPMLPLEALARISRGLTTGNNRVFLPDVEAIRRHEIEERYLVPIVRSPREIAGLDTEGIAAPARLVLPPGPDEGETRAAAYLRACGVERSPYLGRQLPGPAPLLFGYAVRARKPFFRNSAGLLAGDNFHCLTPRREEDLALLFALLNSVPVALLLESQGRGQGRGLLKIQRYELAALRLPDPARLDAGLRRDLEAAGDVLRCAPEDAQARLELDRLAARAFGADADELRRAERELAAARQARREVL